MNRLAEKIRSPLVFAHVRASTMPGAREFTFAFEDIRLLNRVLVASEDNCHPWTFGKLMVRSDSYSHAARMLSYSADRDVVDAQWPNLRFYPH